MQLPNLLRLLAVLPLDAAEQKRCRLEQSGYVFEYQIFDAPKTGIVLYQLTHGWLAFENLCPHFSIPLAEPGHLIQPGLWHLGDRYLNIFGHHLECLHHGAQFSLFDGLSTTSFCAGHMISIFHVEPLDHALMIRG